MMSEKESMASVFDTTFKPSPDKGQFTPSSEELAADAFTFVLAGTQTVSFTIQLGIFELLEHPDMMTRLKQELGEAIPDVRTMLNWTSLEKLPYLVMDHPNPLLGKSR